MKIPFFFILSAALPASALAAPYLENTHIYNNSLDSAESTLAVLGQGSSGFLERPSADKNVRYIFVVINGQQFPCKPNCLGERAEEIFGRVLTGAHRVKEGVSWKGKYAIYDGSGGKNESLALNLHRNYGDSALVVDVLNAKYNWAFSEKKKNAVKAYLSERILRLSAAAEEASGEKPAIALVGFSRGAVLSYVLAGELEGKADVRMVATIDPVINPATETGLVRETRFYNYRKREWQSTPPVFPVFPRFYDFYPVLRTDRIGGNTRLYNVFQRRAMTQFSNFSKPVGSAVSRALSPCKEDYYPCYTYMGDNPEDQLDISMSSHSPEMPERYSKWFMDLFRRNFRVPEPAPQSPPAVYRPPALPRLTVWGFRHYAGEPVMAGWAGDKPGLQYRVAFAPQGSAAAWSGWRGGFFSERFEVPEPGIYVLSVGAKDGRNTVSRSIPVKVEPRPPAINFKPIEPQISFIGEEVRITWTTDREENLFSHSVTGPDGESTEPSPFSTATVFTSAFDRMGQYRLTVGARGRFNSVNRRSITFDVRDYIFEDEGIACGWCGANDHCSFMVAKMIKGPAETANKGHVVHPIYNSAGGWDRDTDTETHFVISKSFPVTGRNLGELKEGQAVVWNAGNPETPRDMRDRYALGEIVSLEKADEGLVTVKRYRGFNAFTEDEKEADLRYHNIRTFDNSVLAGLEGTRPYCNGRFGIPDIEILYLQLRSANGMPAKEIVSGEKGEFTWFSRIPGYSYDFAVVRKNKPDAEAEWSGWKKYPDHAIPVALEKPGDYRFLMKVKNHLGLVTAEPLTADFSVVKK
ncbi:MAG: hypothetical protein RQ748_03380 [Elusimicrobiales bacterium]|nr:hypothetical protein [Elusimicrobiales bacterium]